MNELSNLSYEYKDDTDYCRDCREFAQDVYDKIDELTCMLDVLKTPVFEFFGISERKLNEDETMDSFVEILYSDKSIDDICNDLIELGKRCQ